MHTRKLAWGQMVWVGVVGTWKFGLGVTGGKGLPV